MRHPGDTLYQHYDRSGYPDAYGTASEIAETLGVGHTLDVSQRMLAGQQHLRRTVRQAEGEEILWRGLGEADGCRVHGSHRQVSSLVQGRANQDIARWSHSTAIQKAAWVGYMRKSVPQNVRSPFCPLSL